MHSKCAHVATRQDSADKQVDKGLISPNRKKGRGHDEPHDFPKKEIMTSSKSVFCAPSLFTYPISEEEEGKKNEMR